MKYQRNSSSRKKALKEPEKGLVSGTLLKAEPRIKEVHLDALKKEGINKVLLVAFKKNEGGNAFWESQGFTLREDLNYRNKTLVEMIRIDPDYVK